MTTMTPSSARIAAVARETSDTFTFTVESGTPHPLPRFVPGQFSMLYGFATGEIPISMSGDPGDAHHMVFTIRSVGKASRAITLAERGGAIGIRGPFGTGWPVREAHGRDLLIVAGGIGLAPLRPVIYHFLRHRDSYQRLSVLYGARSPRDLLFRHELSEWAATSGIQLLATVDYAGRVPWKGHVGVVTKLLALAELRPALTTALVCGPEIMMRFVLSELQRRKIAPENIYLSMERNMKCAIGLCGHCQLGPHFLCKDGPVYRYSDLRPWIEGKNEL